MAFVENAICPTTGFEPAVFSGKSYGDRLVCSRHSFGILTIISRNQKIKLDIPKPDFILQAFSFRFRSVKSQSAK